MPKMRDLLIPDPCKPEEKINQYQLQLYYIANENEVPTKVTLSSYQLLVLPLRRFPPTIRVRAGMAPSLQL